MKFKTASAAVIALFFSFACRSGPSVLKNPQGGLLAGILYENGEIRIENKKQSYGGNPNSVKLITKYPGRIPENLKEAVSPVLLASFEKNFPEIRFAEAAEVPVKEIRTIKGKIHEKDYRSMKQDFLIEWKLDITYTCKFSYYMDECQGLVRLTADFTDRTGKKENWKLHSFTMPLKYIDPDNEEPEEKEMIAERLRNELPGALDSLFQSYRK